MPVRTMTSKILIFAFTILAAVFTGRAFARDAGAKDPHLEALRKGRVSIVTWKVKGKPAKQGYSVAVINAPRERVWRVVTDYKNFAKFMTNVTKSEIIKDGPIIKHHRCTVRIPVLGKKYQYTNKVIHDRKHWRISWRQLQGENRAKSDNVTDNNGSWELREFDGDPNKTRLKYSLYLVPGFYVPEILQELIIKPTLRTVMGDVQRRVKDPSYDRPLEPEVGAAESAPPADHRPVIEAISPAKAVSGDVVTLKGAGFKGDGLRVTLGGKEMPLLSTSPTRIMFEVPEGAATGEVRVQIGTLASNGKPLVVISDEGALPAPARRRWFPAHPAGFFPRGQDRDNNGIPDDREQPLADFFKPSMAFSGPDMWPVEVRYAWSGGADLMQVARDAKGKPAGERMVLPNAALEKKTGHRSPRTTENVAPRG